MSALDRNGNRQPFNSFADLWLFFPVAAAVKVFEGSALGITSTGYVKPFVLGAGLKFVGFATTTVDNTTGSNGQKTVEVYIQGRMRLKVAGGSGAAGALTVADVGKYVYATTDNDFSLSVAAGALRLGRMIRREPDGLAEVAFRAEMLNGLSGSTVGRIQQKFARLADMTDDGGASGHIDLTEQLPAGAMVIGWCFDTEVAFNGDTTAVMKVGTAADDDRFTEDTTGSVFAAGTIGSQAQKATNHFCPTATTVRATITGGSDFGAIAALGAGTLTVYYWQTP